MKRIALITGATSGIGEATALLLARNDFDVIITGRRGTLLQKVRKKIESETVSEAIELCFDIRKHSEVIRALDTIPDNWKKIDVLVNNAGLAAGLDHINEGNIDDWEQMIDTNIKGLIYITREISGWMIRQGSGHIINIGSIAGKEVYDKGNIYCATKFAVDALSRGMRIDLVQHHIKVTCIAPGMVETEFSLVRFKGDKKRANKVYEGLKPLSAEDIAEAILFTITRPPHVNINEMLIMPTAQANATVVHRKPIEK
jgi:3-hydroxy acid dehydrogenase / malonic semialdehyde reductase